MLTLLQVREKVKVFASAAVPNVTDSSDRRLPPFKLIILDESDSMSQDAQSALRRIMELYTRVTRFCLLCNYVSRIIDPLASRCAKFRFEPLPRSAFERKISFIAESENVCIDTEAMDTLVSVSKGDLRAGITALQASAQYCGKETVKSEQILEMASLPSRAFLDMIWDSVRSLKFSNIDHSADELQAEGFSGAVVLRLLQDDLIVMNDDRMTDGKKALILQKMARTDFAMVEGADEDLQFRSLLSYMMKTYGEAAN